MQFLKPLEPIDYLVIGHLTVDLTPEGPRLGGSAAYAGLTALALGLRVGIVTSWGQEIPLGELEQIPIVNYPTDKSTTFENVPTETGRIQTLHSVAPSLDLNHVPEAWRSTPIVHLGPVAQEVTPGLIRYFPSSLIGLTPQGWLRAWDENGHVHYTDWLESSFMLGQAGAVVLSTEDVQNDETIIEDFASASRVLAVTEADEGSRLYWNGDVRRFRPAYIEEVDATGAGDIYAAAFFTRLQSTRDPWEAARFATQLSAFSVARRGLQGIPTREEIEESMIEVL
jgi:sugar/nucleoside kinase (ribokinase family)